MIALDLLVVSTALSTVRAELAMAGTEGARH